MSDDLYEFTSEPVRRKGGRGFMRTVSWYALRVSAHVVDAVETDVLIVKREAELFFGALLVIAGMLSFQSNKYCDGNTAEYLSCTRPTTYYYYGGFEIAVIVFGVFLILIWFMKRKG